MTTIQIHLC